MPDQDELDRIVQRLKDASGKQTFEKWLQDNKSGLFSPFIPSKTNCALAAFLRWARSSRSGRQAFFFPKQEEEKVLAVCSGAWLHCFPEHRADFLTERVWRAARTNFVHVQIKVENGFNFSRSTTDNVEESAITLPQEFWNALIAQDGDTSLAVQWKKKVEALAKLFNDKQDQDIQAVKIARAIIKESNGPKGESIVAQREKGLVGAMDFWNRQPQGKPQDEPLTKIFEWLYQDDLGKTTVTNPTVQVHSIAKHFLHMWQTMAVFRPGMKALEMWACAFQSSLSTKEKVAASGNDTKPSRPLRAALSFFFDDPNAQQKNALGEHIRIFLNELEKSAEGSYPKHDRGGEKQGRWEGAMQILKDRDPSWAKPESNNRKLPS